MTDLTPEQEEILAKARASETDEPDEPVVAVGESTYTEDQLAKAEAEQDMTAPEAVTPTRMQGVDEWGPFAELTNVSAPTGTFGVPPGKILYFVPREVFSTRESRMVTIQEQHYRLPDEPRIDEAAKV